MKPIIFGAGSHLGVHVDGAAYGAETLVRDIQSADRRLIMQDLSYEKSRDRADLRKNETELNALNETIYKAMVPAIEAGYFPVLTGGDHSVAVASALASEAVHPGLGVIWVDAHTDFNTFESTESGNIHGLPLAAITGYHCEEIRAFHSGTTIDPHKAVVVGARSVDPGEWINLKDAGVTVFSTEDIKKRGVEEVMEEAFRIAGGKSDGGRVHVSYDLDLIDPQDAPGVSVPVLGGITRQEALAITDCLADHIEQIASFDLVELNPLLDQDQKTEQIAVEILNRILQAVETRES